ncbi:MAG: alpha/beta hydrolase family protein [Rubripirellula sp.]
MTEVPYPANQRVTVGDVLHPYHQETCHLEDTGHGQGISGSQYLLREETIQMCRIICRALMIVVLVASTGCMKPKLMGVNDLDRLIIEPTGVRYAYGSDPLQYGQLTVPAGDGPHPVVVFIHGGCWLSAYDISYTHALAQALAEDGIAVWNLEYRRVGDEGGGWPGTFLDIAAGTDHIQKLAGKHNLDLDRVVAMGHSAGGHLALWLAARPLINSESELYTQVPLPVAGVIGLAPAPELHELHSREVCGHVIDKLMGGSPASHPQRYRDATPSALAPIGVPQTIITGKYDDDWAWCGEAYVSAAREAGDEQIEFIEAPNASHFEVVAPHTSTWNLVVEAVRRHVNIVRR